MPVQLVWHTFGFDFLLGEYVVIGENSVGHILSGSSSFAERYALEEFDIGDRVRIAISTTGSLTTASAPEPG